jgi:hypothetical protein
MNRPWTACGVMFLTLGASLLGTGLSTPRRVMKTGTAVNQGSAVRHIVYCGSYAPLPPSYESSCGLDRVTGVCYPRLNPVPQISSGDQYWPATPRNILHPAVPSFYSNEAAEHYAAAQAHAWRSSIQPLAPLSDPKAETKVIRLSLSTQPSTKLNLAARLSTCVNDALVSIKGYPATHNARITVLALQMRSENLLERFNLWDDWRGAALRSAKATESANAAGLDPWEYEDLVERAMDRLPVPERQESPRPFRPTPSRERLMRMASTTLQRVSDALDAAARHLERMASEDIARRPGSEEAR